MALNGWQRLWVVGSALFALCALLIAVVAWPVDVLDEGRIYRRMSPANVGRLDWFGRFAPNHEQTFDKRQVKTDDGADHVFPANATDAEISRSLNPAPAASTEPNGWTLVRPAKPLTVVASTPAEIVVEGHTLHFREIEVSRPESRYDPVAVANDFRSALHRTLVIDRANLVGRLAGSWLVFVTFLYACGWSVGWVRRGFGPSAKRSR
jgi:hypothetical protein